MNAKQLIVALITVAAAGSAMAHTTPVTQKQASGVTRAQVMAEYQQARANGEINNLDGSYPTGPTVASTLTRADVMAQLKTAKANGELAATDTTYPILPESTSNLSRQQVIAEFTEARARSQIPSNSVDMSYAGATNPNHVSRR